MLETFLRTSGLLLTMVWHAGAHAQPNACIDPSLIDATAICPLVYAPVCGCDGAVYDNSCLAQTQGGVTSWTEGPCEVVSCQDLAGIDFGDCDMVLGIAQVNGTCMTISGCDWVVNGVDYSPAFFEDEPTCTMCNEVPPECGLQLLTSSSDGMWYTFTAIDYPQAAALEWYIDGFLAQSGGDVFEAGFDFNPNWTVCVKYWSDPCGGLVEQCYSNLEGAGPCTDVGAVDFGLCAMALGVAKVNGTCQYVSGCGTYVGGVNYAGAFFESLEECILGCATSCVDDELLALGATVDCLTIYSPVCGCDGVTYGNSCEAMYGGGVTSWTEGECSPPVEDIPGCTYSTACNYNPEANVDDGSCVFPPWDCAPTEGGGCTYEEAINYDPTALFDDGTCGFELPSECFGDLNGDGSISIGDLLVMLGLFGSVC
jgi:hypothetical protein